MVQAGGSPEEAGSTKGTLRPGTGNAQSGQEEAQAKCEKATTRDDGKA